MLYRVAYTILGNDDACCDALQDAALKAWEKRSTLREERYFRTWATRILINACYDAQRKGRRIVSFEEIPEPAVALRILPVSTVRGRIHRAKGELRKELGEG